MADHKIYHIDRRSGEKKEEKIYFEKVLRSFYSSSLGLLLATFFSKIPLFSHLVGWWQRLSITKSHISPFIEKYQIDASEFEKAVTHYSSFNAFFIRKLKKEARPLAPGIIAPADGRYLVYQNISCCDGFVVKGKKFLLSKLLGDGKLARVYAAGSMAIIRLAPSDYHRFHFPVECIPSSSKLINGPLFSVNPIAVKRNLDLLTENKRMITHLATQAYGTVLYIEIGATNVGSIHQTFVPKELYKKGDEKGYFSFGASCVILLFEQGKIHFSNDLILNSQQHVETLCLFGQPLADKK